MGPTGCAVDSPPQLSEISSASTVGDYANMGCSTSVVIGLSKQIAEQANCEHPGNFVPFMAGGGITFASSAVLPYLQQGARDDLVAVGQSDPLIVTSGLRTLAQQYLLVSWFQAGMCGITAAAAVGTSNHEGGRAVDLSNYSSVISAMAAHGWAHDVPGDDVHFDHTSSPANLGEDIHGFQVLWNLNNPSDQITADGSYGPQTEMRLVKSPATGFAMGPTCTTSPGMFGVDVVSIAGPDSAPPQTQVHYSIVLKNTGNVDWPATTTLALANGTSSQLHDASWTSDTVVTTIGAKVPAGMMGTVAFDVTTPAVDAQTAVSETFALNDGGTQFGMIGLALTVTPDMTGPMPGDGNGTGAKHAGCSAAGGSGAGGTLLALVAIASVARRRRR